jgi:hypothetical protein
LGSLAEIGGVSASDDRAEASTIVDPEVPLFVGVDEYPVGRGCVTWVVIVGELHPGSHFRLLWGVLVPSVLQPLLVKRGGNRCFGCGWLLGSAGWMSIIPRFRVEERLDTAWNRLRYKGGGFK